MPRLGKIRLGIKVRNAKGVEYPKDVDYFVCPPEVQEVYGPQPRELDVLIPCADPSLYFPQALKWYQGSRLVCKGDGQTATRINTKTGEMTEIACPCEHLRNPQTNPKGECSPRANLMVILPKISMGGAYQIDTGSANNIINLNSTLAWIQSMLGRVAWVPLVLKRVPTKIQTPDGTTTKALLQLEFRGTLQDAAALRHADWISLQGGSVPTALPPLAEDDDGPGDVTADVLDEDTEGVPNVGHEAEPPEPAKEATEEPAQPAKQAQLPLATEPEEPDEELPIVPHPHDEVKDLVATKALLLSASGSMPILSTVWKDIVRDPQIPAEEKVKLQAIYDRKKLLRRR